MLFPSSLAPRPSPLVILPSHPLQRGAEIDVIEIETTGIDVAADQCVQPRQLVIVEFPVPQPAEQDAEFAAEFRRKAHGNSSNFESMQFSSCSWMRLSAL